MTIDFMYIYNKMIIAPSTIEYQIYYTLGATPLEGLKKYVYSP